MTQQTRGNHRRQAGWIWPWLVGALLVCTAGGQAIMLYAATHDPTFAIEPDYYNRAVAWDTTMANDRATIALGWKASAAMSSAVGPGSTIDATVHVAVVDRDGTPVRGARVRATAVHNLDGSHQTSVSFVADGDTYVATMVGARRGLWELRLDVTRDDAHFTPLLRLDYPP